MLVLLLFTTLFAMPATVADDINVFIDGKKLEHVNLPIIQEGRTLAPMRAFFEALGDNVSWDSENQIAIGTRGNVEVRIPIGSTKPTVNSQAQVIQVPAQIIEKKNLYPLAFCWRSTRRRSSLEWYR